MVPSETIGGQSGLSDGLDMRGELEAYAVSVFSCGTESIHGVRHWKNVDDAGLLIVERTPDVDPVVVLCFAYLHDAFRNDDGSDLEHGPRSADRLNEVPQNIGSMLTEQQLQTLEYAIRHHTDGKIADDPTVGACWDGDRLDLGRVGMIPSATLMSTDVGKQIAIAGSRKVYLEA